MNRIKTHPVNVGLILACLFLIVGSIVNHDLLGLLTAIVLLVTGLLQFYDWGVK